MAYRKELSDNNLSEKVFRKYANNTKTVNVNPKTMRGGTRF